MHDKERKRETNEIISFINETIPDMMRDKASINALADEINKKLDEITMYHLFHDLLNNKLYDYINVMEKNEYLSDEINRFVVGIVRMIGYHNDNFFREGYMKNDGKKTE